MSAAPWVRVAAAMTAVGWGANQFAGLLLVYRADGASDGFISGAVGVYAAGLIPALLLMALAAGRVGTRTAVRAAVLLSALGTGVLIAGAEADALLFVGRFIVGAATGIVLAPGTAWVMELSRSAGTGAGARRATIALSLGFGGGPTIAGLIGQWLPAPEVTPYLAHLALTVVTGIGVWTAPATVRTDAAATGPAGVPPAGATASPGTTSPGAGATLASSAFLRAVPLTAPWVFGVATTAFAVMPTVVPVTTLPVATSATITGLTLAGGVFIQPWGKRLEHRRPGSALQAGMLLAAAGMLAAAAAVAIGHPSTLFVVAAVLGAAYGLLLVGGLSRLEVLTHPEDRTRVNAVFYTLTYLGFAVPYLVVLLTEHWFTPGTVLLAGAVIALLTLLALPRARRAETTPVG